MKTAVVLMNLGGPDNLDAVRPFLFNLFNDPAIIGLPGGLRWLVAQMISRRRAPVAREIYAKIGGASPLLPETRDQAAALEAALGNEHKVFICMRYWRPFAAETAREVAAWGPERIVLLPLYPQFSTTTSASSLADWVRAAEKAGLAAATRAICCYPLQVGWIAAQVRLLAETIAKAPGPCRVLFSAHGLPEKIVAGGDPYQWQVEQTARAIADAAGLAEESWRVCYQSRVGPLKWIGPSIDEELHEAAENKIAVAVLPVAFVSEHSETLVELDMEYADKARALGIPGYLRVPAVGTAPEFIAGLADLVETSAGIGTAPAEGSRLCPAEFGRCLCKAAS